MQVLRCCTELTPCIMAARIDLRLLNAILELVNGGGFTVQTAGLGALSSALRTLELDIYRSALILRCLHEVIELWVRAGPFRHELLPAWTAGLELCLEHLAVAAPGPSSSSPLAHALENGCQQLQTLDLCLHCRHDQDVPAIELGYCGGLSACVGRDQADAAPASLESSSNSAHTGRRAEQQRAARPARRCGALHTGSGSPARDHYRPARANRPRSHRADMEDLANG